MNKSPPNMHKFNAGLSKNFISTFFTGHLGAGMPGGMNIIMSNGNRCMN